MIRSEVGQYARQAGFPLQYLGISSWLQPDFQVRPVRCVRDVNYRNNCAQFELLRRYMLTSGFILGDVPILFTSAAHTDQDIQSFIQAFKTWIKERV
jgi:glutamate-1-semialdehyde aminotransferase